METLLFIGIICLGEMTWNSCSVKQNLIETLGLDINTNISHHGNKSYCEMAPKAVFLCVSYPN